MTHVAKRVDVGPGTPARPAAPARNGAEAIVQLLAARGVEYIFLNPGTDTAPLQEALVALAAAGERVPVVVPCLYENVAIAAAHAYFQVTGRAQVVLVHVDVGTQNLGGNLHDCQRGQGGVVILAGRAPYTVDGDLPGGRDMGIQWQQDQPDQISIVRNYVKWAFELGRTDTLHHLIPRAFQMAESAPAGPVYMTVAREVLMEPMDGVSLEVAARTRNLISSAGDPDALEVAAGWLLEAESPLAITGYVGRRLGAVGHLVELADQLGMPVVDIGGPVNFPASHPLWREGPSPSSLAAADVVLLIDVDAPWIPRLAQPAPGARIVQLDIDPLKVSIPLWGFPVDLPIQADTSKALPLLRAALERRAGPGELARWQRRREAAASTAPRSRIRANTDITPTPPRQIEIEDVGDALNEAIAGGALFVEEAVTNAAALRRTLRRDQPGSWFHAGGPGIGWALGAAIGTKLAAPQRVVVTIVGDGSFVFGSPVAALWAAQQAHAPFLAVVLDNGGYRAAKEPVLKLFPGGASVQADLFPGVRFPMPPDYSALARSCHAHGERVQDPAELAPALGRALAAVREGQAAVVDVLMAPI